MRSPSSRIEIMIENIVVEWIEREQFLEPLIGDHQVVRGFEVSFVRDVGCKRINDFD